MTILAETPVPQDSGSDGSQTEADPSDKLVQSHPSGWPAPLDQGIQGLISANPRAFGGENATALLGASFAHISADLTRCQQELYSLRKEHEETKKELATALTRKAILAERIDSFRYTRHLANMGIAFGVAAISGSLQLFTEQNHNYAYFAVTIGAFLLIGSWISAAPKGSDK